MNIVNVNFQKYLIHQATLTNITDRVSYFIMKKLRQYAQKIKKLSQNYDLLAVGPAYVAKPQGFFLCVCVCALLIRASLKFMQSLI